MNIQDDSIDPFRERILEIVTRYGARHAVQDVLIDALAAAMARFRSSEAATLRTDLAAAREVLEALTVAASGVETIVRHSGIPEIADALMKRVVKARAFLERTAL